MTHASESPDAVFAALADPTRRTVLRLLAAGDGATATELSRRLPVTRQAVAQHLSALSAAGLVERSREGREVTYRLTPEPMGRAISWMAEVGTEWDEHLESLRRHVEGAG